MKPHTFKLLNKRPFALSTPLYLIGKDGKLDKREVRFSTAHLVGVNDRIKKARTVAAEVTLVEEAEINAIFRDTGYGTKFVLKGDDEGKLKKAPLNITAFDATKVALKNLFAKTDLEFDDTKPNAVLEKELTIYLNATTGKEVTKGQATEIKHEPINVEKSIEGDVEAAIKAYEETNGVDFPEFANKQDKLNFIDGLSNPNFEQEAFIEKHAVKEDEGDDLPTGDAEALGVIYKTLFGKNVANLKKNDAAWIEAQIKAKQAE